MKIQSEKFIFEYTPGPHKVNLFFPNNYSAAMGSLGFQTAFHFLNSCPEFDVTRSYFESGSRKIFSKPSGEIIAVSIAFELDIFNLVKQLIDWGIEPLAARRKGPLVIAGGVLPLINPLPLSPFVDLFLIGDGELLIPTFSELYTDNYLSGKAQLLKMADKLKGFWVPIEGIDQSFEPLIQPRNNLLHSVILSSESHFGEMFLVEVGRGCPRRCRFCASSHIHDYEYHPAEEILKLVDKYGYTGFKSVGLIGSALSDYPEFKMLADELVKRGYRLGVSSLRPDVITSELAGLLKAGGVKTMTIAPEAGSLRMRRLIGKGMSDRVIMEGIENSRSAGIDNIKLYFLIGLPGEKSEDIDAISGMIQSVKEVYPENSIEVSINAFVPKPHTPFQWSAMSDEKYIGDTRKLLKKIHPNIRFSKRSTNHELNQGLLSLGDEKVGRAVLDSVLKGISLKSALRDLNQDYRELLSTRNMEFCFPWDNFRGEVSKQYLLNEWRRLSEKYSVIRS